MSRIREYIEQLEYKFDRGDVDFLERRLLLRKAFDAVWAEALAEGRQEGMSDVHAARNAERQAEAAAARAAVVSIDDESEQ